MSEYTPWNPKWFYTRVNVNCLEQIQKEFEEIRKNHWHKFCDYNIDEEDANWWDFSAMPREVIEPHTPVLVEWLDSKGILDKWSSTAFSVVNKEDKPMRIHIDSTLTDERRVSLNMPFLNCNNTWTCWYDCEIDQHEVPTDVPPEVLHSRFQYDPSLRFGRWGIEQGAKEIARAEMNTPVLVNVTIPHRPISGHNLQRILLCHRFTPELTKEEMDRICNL